MFRDCCATFGCAARTEISVTLHVSNRDAQPLLSGADALDDILILRLENGRDYFVTISGQYQRSCFGASLEYLTNCLQPLRSMPLLSSTPTQTLSIPKELWRMVDYIYRNGLREDGLFSTSGEEEEVHQIKESLDNGTEFGSFSVHSMCEVLVYFLKNLAEPVFPEHIVEQYNEQMPLTTYCKQALMQLAPAHYNTFIYVIAFLREILKHREYNHISDVTMTIIFGSCLMPCDALTQDWDAHGVARVNSNNNNNGSGATFPSNNANNDKPKAWVILRHFLTSSDFN